MKYATSMSLAASLLIFAALPQISSAQQNEQMLSPPPMPQQAPMQQEPMQQAPMQQQMQQAPMPAAGAPIGDPGYYGQVDLVNNTPPPLIYSTPMVVQPAPPGVYYPPVYLRVPPMYYQNWPQYCGFYNACFYPVFFVQEGWYMNIYSPWYHRYYPYGRPGFTARVFYNGHGGGYRGEPHYDRGVRHDEHGHEHHE
jgi:hypothetical protein